MEGIIALAEGLSKCPSLEFLDLQDNTFSQAGSKAFGAALPSWPALHTLNFSDCVLSKEGEVPHTIEILVTGSNPRLHTLQLQNNNLEAQTAAVLAQAIGTHLKEVSLLEFQWNEVDDEDENVQTLLDSMKARGGKFLLNDEDEGSEEEEEEEEETTAEDADELLEKPDAHDSVDDDTDTLADLMSKASIN